MKPQNLATQHNEDPFMIEQVPTLDLESSTQEESDGNTEFEPLSLDLDEDIEAEVADAPLFSEDTVQYYLNQISHKKVLTHEEERRYVVAAKQGDEKSRNKLIEGNLRLVISVAKRYLNRGVPFADLIEEGNLGMMHAIDKFDPERGLRFSTYATWWIRQNIARAVMNQGRTIRLPVHVLRDFYHVLDAKKTIEKSLNDGRSAKPEAIAKMLNRNIEDINDLLSIGESIVSLDKTVDEENQSAMIDFLMDENHLPDISLAEKEESDIINNWLKKLYATSPKHYDIIVARYGLNGAETKTFDELSQELGVTRERVRQMMNDALSKLKASLNTTRPSGVNRTK